MELLDDLRREVRAPLNGILGAVELLAVGPLDAHQAQCCRVLRDSSGSLLRLVLSALDLAELRAGHLKIERAPLALSPVVARAVAGVKNRASRRGLEIVVVPARGLPRAIGDAARIGQVLANLLSDSIESCSGGEVRLEVSCSRSAVRVAVRDGRRAPRPGSPALGLALSRGLVEAMGGSSGAGRLPEGGFLAWFTLPRHPVVTASAPEVSADRLTMGR